MTWSVWVEAVCKMAERAGVFKNLGTAVDSKLPRPTLLRPDEALPITRARENVAKIKEKVLEGNATHADLEAAVMERDIIGEAFRAYIQGVL